MTKPRQLETLRFKISCKRWNKAPYVQIKDECGYYDTWFLEDLNKVITHLIKCRSWMEEETK